MTTSGRNDLPDAAESLLAGWPAPPKSALSWEDFASRTMQAARERAADAPSPVDDALLFEAPLPAEAGEGNFALPAEAEEPGLLSIAQKVVAANTGASPKEIALAGMQAAQAERRDAPLGPPPRPPTRAEQEAQAVAGLMGRTSGASKPADPEPVRPVPVVRAAHVPVEASAHSEVPRPRTAPSKKPWAAVTAGGAALAMAAALALFVSGRQEAPAVASAELPATPPHTAAAAAAPGAPAVEPAPIASQAAQLESLPQVAAASKEDTLAFRVKKGNASGLVLEPKVARAPAAAKPSPEPAAKKAGSLNDEMAQAVGEKAVKAAPPGNQSPVAQEDLPDRPSVGDAQAAAGPALMKARMCLAGQEAGSQAKITFGSNGRVKNVTISGPAAGTPAESCLRSQLSSARVPPFSEKSFSFSLTVRPP